MSDDIQPTLPTEAGNITPIPVHASHVITTADGKVGFVLPQPSAISVAIGKAVDYVKANYPVVVAACLGGAAVFLITKL